MVQLKLKLATTTEASIKSITEQLQHFSNQITVSAHNPETNEITFDLDVASDDAYQALGDTCQEWTTEPANPTVLAYTMVRG
jgi:hypothetical protein